MVGQAFQPVYTGWKARATSFGNQEKIPQFAFLEVPIKNSLTPTLFLEAKRAGREGKVNFHLNESQVVLERVRQVGELWHAFTNSLLPVPLSALAS